MKGAKSVDEYLAAHEEWAKELELLRKLVNATGLDETVKWGAPAYTYKSKNLIGLAAFKSYVGLWFHQGVLLKDKSEKLMNAQEGVTKALRQWRFSGLDEIKRDSKVITAYVKEAIENQEQGKAIAPNRNKPINIPEELKKALETDKELQEAFDGMSKTNKRSFSEHISSAKRADTKAKRLAAILPMIRRGEGLHDKYRNC